MVYKILAYKVEHIINGIGTFDSFFKQRIYFQNPPASTRKKKKASRSNLWEPPKPSHPKIRDNLPFVRKSYTSGSDVEIEDTSITERYVSFL